MPATHIEGEASCVSGASMAERAKRAELQSQFELLLALVVKWGVQ